VILSLKCIGVTTSTFQGHMAIRHVTIGLALCSFLYVFHWHDPLS